LLFLCLTATTDIFTLSLHDALPILSDKVKKFPITYSQRRKNMMGPLHVECQVSGRYLQFHEKSDIVQGGEFITVDVMPMQIEDEDRKSTRLNSSHVSISYAVFCLKK